MLIQRTSVPNLTFPTLGAIDFLISKNYPARGEYTGSV